MLRNVSRISYLDWMCASTMAGSHISVALSDCTTNGQVTVLAVHVVGARTWVITQPDSEVLDLQRSLLVLALDGDDLTGCLLEFAQLTQEIPETRLGDDVIRCKDDHLEEWRVWLLLGRQLATDDLIFLQLKQAKQSISHVEHKEKEIVRSSREIESKLKKVFPWTIIFPPHVWCRNKKYFFKFSC